MKKLKIKEGTKQIDSHQYAGRNDIDELVIANSVEEIGEGAFCECPNLKKITWGSGIHVIQQMAFYKCTSLELLYLPGSIKRVGAYAFSSCPSLAYVEFEDGDGVDLGYGVFDSCTGLIYAILPNGSQHQAGTFFGCRKLEDVFIPGSVTSIGHWAFCGVAAEQIELPDSIEAIGESSFFNSRLTSIVIPNNVLTIGESALEHCHYLKSAEIGDSVVSIGKKAFNRCVELNEVTFRSTIIGTIGRSAFTGCEKLRRINVPMSAMEIYKRLLPKYLHRKLVGF